MRTEEQMASIIQRVTTEAQGAIARKWGIPSHVIAGATLGLGVSQLRESGFTEEQIVDHVRGLLSPSETVA